MFGIPKPPFYRLIYEYGFPEFKKPRKMLVKITDNSILLYITKLPFWYSEITIPKSGILEINMDNETYRSAGKAAAGAIAGTLLTGGIGLIAGAAIGGKRRKQSTLQLAVHHEGRSCILGIKPNKQVPRLYTEIKHMMS